MELKVDYGEFQSNQDNIKVIFDEIQLDITSKAPKDIIVTLDEILLRNELLIKTIDEIKLQLK